MIKIIMLRKGFVRAIYGFLLLSVLTSFNTAFAQDVVLDRIRAVVNNGVVLDSEVQAAIVFFKQQAISNRQSLPSDEVLAERVLEQLIDREIRRQHASEIGIAIDASSINRAIEGIARGNNMDALQFRKTLQLQGFDYDLFRQNIEQELLMQRLIEQEVQPRIRVSAQEIDDFIVAVNNDAEKQQRYRVQHILVALPAAATAEQISAANERAQTLLGQLRAGRDFGEVATASSDGARALQGGDLGWRTLQEVPQFLADALRTMEPGDIIGPLQSVNGLHIIRLTDRQSGDQTRLAETLARHIFIAGDGAAIETKLRTLRQQIQAGTSFQLAAAQFSEDPNSADKGGELPWFSQGQMPPAIEEMANSLPINQVSLPFRTQYGWHLLEVLERRTRAIDEDALRNQANNVLRQRKVEQETERWLRQLRDESFVDIRT